MIFAQRTKTIKWSDFFEVAAPAYVALRITPDSSARNWRTEDITRSVADMFRLPVDRFTKDGLKVRYRVQERATFEIVFMSGKVRFYLCVPENVAPVFIRRLQSVWPDSTIEPDPEYDAHVGTDAAIYELVYKRHDLYSLHTDSKDNLPLPSLMEAGRLLDDGEAARVFAYFDPIHQASWHQQLTDKWQKLREGHSPRKIDASIRNLLFTGAVGLSQVMKEIVTGIGDLMSNDNSNNVFKDKPADPEATKYAMDQLSQATRQKQAKPAIRTHLWVAADAQTKTRADMIARTMAGAFMDISGDNELTARVLRGRQRKAALKTMETKKPPEVKITCNYMSSAEAAKIVQVAGRELQEKYPEIDALESKELEIDKTLTAGGMKLGEATYRGQTQPVYMPVNDADQLCLPVVVLGGMGQGKTRGYLANQMVESIKNGFGALAIDPAKGEIGDEIEAALPAEKVYRVRLGKQVIGLDWREVLHSEKSKNRLAHTIIGFFNTATDEAGARTARYIRAAVMGMQTGRLGEIMRIFEDPDYRASIIQQMPDGLHRTTLVSYGEESENMQRRILEPIYNRMDTIIGDQYLSECMETENGLDFVEIMSRRHAVIIDVPKTDLGAEAVDLIVNLLTTKIDLAMTLREPVNQFPFKVCFDEPHQFLRSARTWKSAAVESRKWRVGYVWSFHSWEQIPRDLAAIIKAALPHYTIYPSSKQTFQELREEIYPFTVEDGLRLKRYHAINVIRAGETGLAKPVIAHMAPPPSSCKPARASDTLIAG